MKPTLLLIEDNLLWKNQILVQLEHFGYENISICDSIHSAVAFLEKKIPDVIIGDIILEKNTIFDLFENEPAYCKIPIVLITISEDESMLNVKFHKVVEVN